MTTLSVIMPALNEQDNIGKAVIAVLAAFDTLKLDGEIVVINDGSTDRTAEIVAGITKKEPRVQFVNHSSPCGIGASFWDGAEKARGESVCLMPGDNGIDPVEALRYCATMSEVDILVPYFYNNRIRGFQRNFISNVFRFIINASFGTSFNYTNGSIVYRRNVLLSIPNRVSGFFYQTDILIRLVKQGYLYAEVPAKLQLREGGCSKALSLKSLSAVTMGYLKLCKAIYIKKEHRKNILPSSATYKRTRP